MNITKLKINNSRKESSYPNIMSFGTKSATEENDIVKLFAEYFSTVYSNTDYDVPDYNT